MVCRRYRNRSYWDSRDSKEKQYAKIKDELEAIDYKKVMAKYQLDDMNNQITYLNRIRYNKRKEIEYLKIGAQELEGYVHGLENHNQ
jgi:predicted site-specific integrase-resolvase